MLSASGEGSEPMKDERFIIPAGIALISSFIYGIWNLLSYNIVTVSPGKILFSLFLMMAAGALISFLYLLATSLRKGKLKINEFMKYPVAGGIFFALGNIIFFSMIRVEALPVVAAMVYSNIIIFSFLLAKRTKARLSVLYILGTVVAVIGLALMEVFNSGEKGAFDLQSIAESVLLIIFYSFGSYFIYITSLNREKAENSIFLIFLTETAVIAVAALFYGGLAQFSITSGPYALEIVITAAVLVLAILLEFKSFRLISQFKTKYINIVNIFLNFETIWVLIFSVIFLSVSSSGVIIGVLVTSLGIWIVSSS